MEIQLLYHTPYYPKLVEACARQCYCSEDKSTPKGLQLVRNLLSMNPPHLSIAQHGNIIIGFNVRDEEEVEWINLFIEHSHGYLVATIGGSYDYVISGNVVAWYNAINGVHKVAWDKTKSTFRDGSKLINLNTKILELIFEYPDVRFFFDQWFNYDEFDNPYIYERRGKAQILVIDECPGLTDYEKDKHLTATVWVKTTRDISFQFNRHEAPISQQDAAVLLPQSTDLAGISQQSQRYVFPFPDVNKVSEFLKHANQDWIEKLLLEFEVPEDIDPDEPMNTVIEVDGNRYRLDYTNSINGYEITYRQMMDTIRSMYLTLFFHLTMKKGLGIKRSQEISRSILTNNITSRVIYTRTKWRWRHFIDLRRTAHAQKEARRDMIPILEEFHKHGWFTEYEINQDNLTAERKGGVNYADVTFPVNR